MSRHLTFAFISFFLIGNDCLSQTCTAPGQTPESALFICGSVSMTLLPGARCGSYNLPIPCADNYPYRNTNPMFFKILCYNSGTLGFSILPNDPNANFSWVLYDVTGSNPVDVFTNPNLMVACNWSSDAGETGASIDGTSLVVCSGSQPLFSKMPDLVRGRTYILMILNESGSTQPYEFTVGTGSASITDPTIPALIEAGLACQSTTVWVKFNKLLACQSIAYDGSDFSISGGANILQAIPGSCATIFGTDSVYLKLDRSLPYGRYQLTMQTGTDGNTVGDICQQYIPGNDTVGFTVGPLQPTRMDSIKPTGCSPGYIELVFTRPIQCSSIAADGSDFNITGPQSLTAFPVNCNGDQKVIRLGFGTGNIIPGDYQIQLKTGNDGNTLLDQCGMETPPATLSFKIKEFVTAAFTYNIPPTCSRTKVEFFHDGSHNVNSWNWSFGNGLTSTSQNPIITFNTPGNHSIKLMVSNGICTDTASANIITNEVLKAAFIATSMACSGDTVHFENVSTGAVDSWNWDFGDRRNSTAFEPSGISFAGTGHDAYYTVSLTAKNNTLNCEDKFSRTIKVLGNCLIRVPTAFSPNNDGRNDLLYPLNALKANKLQFRVYDRLGQLVFSTSDWQKKWDGSFKGSQLPEGVYAWLLEYIDPSTNQRVFLKGTTMLIR